MPLETPKKRRMWVLPAPIGEIDQASRASIILEYAWVPWVRLAGEITTIFNSLFVWNIFSSAGKADVFVGSPKQGSFFSDVKNSVFSSNEHDNIFISEKDIK
jgi:hypothetical protein